MMNDCIRELFWQEQSRNWISCVQHFRVEEWLALDKSVDTVSISCYIREIGDKAMNKQIQDLKTQALEWFACEPRLWTARHRHDSPRTIRIAGAVIMADKPLLKMDLAHGTVLNMIQDFDNRSGVVLPCWTSYILNPAVDAHYCVRSVRELHIYLISSYRIVP